MWESSLGDPGAQNGDGSNSPRKRLILGGCLNVAEEHEHCREGIIPKLRRHAVQVAQLGEQSPAWAGAMGTAVGTDALTCASLGGSQRKGQREAGVAPTAAGFTTRAIYRLSPHTTVHHKNQKLQGRYLQSSHQMSISQLLPFHKRVKKKKKHIHRHVRDSAKTI